MKAIKLTNEMTDPDLFIYFSQSRAAGALLELDLLEARLNTLHAKKLISKTAHEELGALITQRRQLHAHLLHLTEKTEETISCEHKQ